MKKIACFITPHGFGHATRMTAVLEGLQKRIPNLQPQLFSTVPESLFGETLDSFRYHPLACDIGLIQKNGLQTDLPATIRQLEDFLPFDDALLNELAEKIKGCRLVLCDIAPLGIAVAGKAGIPSVLIENFTWDWIYRAYLPRHPALQGGIDYLRAQYQRADIHIRTEPFCGPERGELHCGPVFRSLRTPRHELRRKLRCGEKRVVLISMGGIDVELPFVHRLSTVPETLFLIAGQDKNHQPADNVLLLSRDSGFYHPDLINAADLVVCKSGYSTVAECCQGGVPIVTVGRATFPESAVLERFCAARLNGRSIDRQEFLSGSWLSNLESLCSTQPQAAAEKNGADTIADYLLPLLS